MGLMENETISLETLKGGAVIQLFNEELAKVMENIMDPNTEAEAVREVTLKVKIKPDRDRATGSVQIIPTAKLAPAVALGTRMFFGKKGGKYLAWEHDPQQLQLPMSREDVSSIRGGRSQGE